LITINHQAVLLKIEHHSQHLDKHATQILLPPYYSTTCINHFPKLELPTFIIYESEAA